MEPADRTVTLGHMPASAFLSVDGPMPETLQAVDTLMRLASQRGVVRMADPAAVANGKGGVEIVFADLDDTGEAQAIARSLIDQVPGAVKCVTIVDEDPDAA